MEVSEMRWISVLVIWLIVLSASLTFGESLEGGLRVALHAQVEATKEKVVGSVITTDGIRAALRRRSDVEMVKVFYPFLYEGYLQQTWDLVLIEGWFPMIHEFIQITRSHSPEVVVLFYCLDPNYPGLDQILQFDVDGYLTNSAQLVSVLSSGGQIPVELMLLAADPDVMRPLNQSMPAKYGAVYVGAGGAMMTQKPQLVASLKAAVPFGLRIFGAGWGDVNDTDLLGAWGGVLPRRHLSQAYSDARVVLAFTIEAQRLVGMINNRVFEALACGAQLLSDRFDSLEVVSQGTVEFASSPEELGAQLARLQRESPEQAAERGRRARALVLRRHTWAHRVVQLLAFFHKVRAGRRQTCCSRPNCPTLLWFVSSNLIRDADYGSVLRRGAFRERLCAQYRIIELPAGDVESRLTKLLAAHRARSSSNSTSANSDADGDADGDAESETKRLLHWFLQYDVVQAVMQPGDSLDRLMADVAGAMGARPEMSGKRRMQKWVGYFMHTAGGEGTGQSENHTGGASESSDDIAFLGAWAKRYDMLLFRDSFEQTALVSHAERLGYPGMCALRLHEAQRCELAFGLGGGAQGARADSLWKDNEKETNDVDKSKNKGAGWEDEDEDERVGAEVGGKARNLSDTSQRDVVVCYLEWSHLCRANRLAQILDSFFPGLSSQPLPLLLVGGTWEDWLEADLGLDVDSPRQVLAYEALPRVVFVGHDDPTDWGESLLSRAQRVFFMLGGDNLGRNEVDNSGELRASSILLGETTPEPSHSPIWPFVLSAQRRALIFLPFANSRILSLAESGLAVRWDEKHVDATVRMVAPKLHGMGASTSRVSGSVMAVVERAFGNTHDDNNNNNKEDNNDGEHKNELDQGEATGTSSPGQCTAMQSRQHQRLTVLLALDLQDFELGRDGQICIELARKKLSCMIRRDNGYISVDVRLGVRGPETAAAAEEECLAPLASMSENGPSREITLVLRGNMFADILWRATVTLPLVAGYAPSHLSAEERDRFAEIARTQESFIKVAIDLP